MDRVRTVDNSHVSHLGLLQPIRGSLDDAWIRNAIQPFASYEIGCLVPGVYPAYARILHPAWSESGEPVAWGAVAASAGTEVHALAQFANVSRAPEPPRPAPFDRRPDDGSLASYIFDDLIEILAAHTATPDHCFIGFWAGRGGLENIITAHIQMPEREHLVLSGPIRAAKPDRGGALASEISPSLMWPADRAWFLATDVDLGSTYVGGTQSLVDALISDERIEAWPAQVNSSITWASDTINPLPQRTSS